MKNTNEREPKANYFLRRMLESYAHGLPEKGNYYLGRLRKMGVHPKSNAIPLLLRD